MGDYDDDQDGDNDIGINMTGFLFGNIDENGQLEDDILDAEAKQHLSSLGRLGLGSILNEMIMSESSSVIHENGDHNVNHQNDDDDYDRKSPSAFDFSDINELADDNCDIKIENDVVKMETETNYDADDENVPNKSDTQLMPPPPLPLGEKNNSNNNNGDDDDDADDKDDVLTPEEVEAARQRKLETPLASMLPSKYANISVTELFPDFRPNKVLRFSRLFGPGKPSSLPQIWRGANRHKRKKRKRHHDSKDSDSGSDQDDRRIKFKGWKMSYGPIPDDKNKIASDDEAKLLTPTQDKEQTGKPDTGENDDMGPKAADWRFGPAQHWYDLFNVPENGEDFTYGFRLTDNNNNNNNNNNKNNNNNDDEKIADDAFLMVSQLHWEDDVVWNGEEIKHKVIQKLNSKNNAAGWVPSSGNRTAQAFSQPGKGGTVSVAQNVRLATSNINTPLHLQTPKNKQSGGGGGGGGSKINQQNQARDDFNYDDTWYSIFPVENEELVYGLWEDEVIWDPMNMKKIPKPKILTLDPNDENIVLGIPEDIDPALAHKENGPQPKVKIPHPHVKKSKLLLGKAGVITTLEEDAPPPPPKSPDHDPFNISNDIFYMPRSSETTLRIKVGGGNLIQHSTPVVELRAPFIQTHIGPMRLRNFHRMPIKRYSHGTLATPGPHSAQPLLKHIKKKAKQREQERIASGGGDVFFMRAPDDLTGKDGELVLVEFSEEHPPLINQVGMCSKVKNYYKRRPGNDYGPKKYKYGETAYAHTTPFLGVFTPGQTIQAIENNMYRAPIYEHNVPQTDFLIIRTRNQYYIREIDALFVAGQECPLYEVPGPNSKRANNFVRDFLQVFIYRLFWKSTDLPRRIKMDDIKTAFPSHSESSIRKRLKLCADFKRTGMDSNWWVIKPDFRLPSEEEIRAMVSPEQCCAYFSMIAAEQRLKDAGYGEKFLFTPQDDDDEEMQGKMEDEVKVAPWNTTRAYIQAMKGKCLLQLTGPADPTGQGEGFSYVRVPNKPTVSKEEQESQPKRTVTGTDADLRRLPLRDAKAILRKHGVPEEEIKKLSRWEVIDVVRTLSTEKAKAGEEGMTKFSRGNRYSIAEHQERYKEECQRIFDLQNRVLASAEILSTDDGESYDDDSSDIEEMGKNLENMLANKKTSIQLSEEKEEQARQELRKMMMSDDNINDNNTNNKDHKNLSKDKKNKGNNDDDNNRDNKDQNNALQPGKVLKISRTFHNADGKEFTRIEIVKKPAVIDTYIKIRESRDENYIRNIASPDDQQKEMIKREKRRIQEQLRRIRRNQERNAAENQANNPSLLSSSSLFNIHDNRSNTSLSSSSALGGGGALGTMPSSSSLLASTSNNMSSFNSHMSSSSMSTLLSNKNYNKNDSLSPSKRKKSKLKPDLKLKCGACGNVGHMRTNKACPLYQSGMSTMPTSGIIINSHNNYHHHNNNSNNNSNSNINNIGNMNNDETEEDMASKHISNDDQDLVNIEGVKLKFSSKLTKMIDQQNAEEMKKKSLLIKLPKDNSNTKKRRRATGDDHCDYLKRHQKTTNRRRTDPVVVMTTIFENILGEMRNIPDVAPFLVPVNAKKVVDYYNLIVRPMDLQTIRENLRQKKYLNRKEFLEDVNQIVENSTLYNGPKHVFTLTAQRMLNLCVDKIGEKERKLMALEKAINPLLDDDDQSRLTFLLKMIINEKVKLMPEVWPFNKPVNGKQFKDYYNIIKRPMDLETIMKKVEAHKYQSRHDFLRDIEQILDNCTLYNGKDSSLVRDAEKLFQVCKDALDECDEDDDFLTKLEKKIALAQQRIANSQQTDVDSSSWFGPDDDNYTINENEFRSSQTNSPEQQFNSNNIKSRIDDFDFVDVEGEGDMEINDNNEKCKIKDVLEEDLQFSSEDDDDFHEVPFNNNDNNDIGVLDARETSQIPPDDDSQQVAEAMVQLEESMDVDPNYDPSDFLLAGLPARDDRISNEIHEDLAVSESDEEVDNNREQLKQEQQPSSQPDEDDGAIWF
ncbi:transcription initiation factor TFIID subunit 1-like isoform X2 [Aphidius gifuensis]|uniref:transcription initiation factor TFIID subunit 1-like isoform X2 n=1 Tax=Aphidius gifuensis TaxID=684658 RepID=UPI001CDCDB2F|nr:transcription initiation factor TFIID subunit 1-like isoform X2 [Aphidius gifuensis]